jgi:hypothetical protein
MAEEPEDLTSSMLGEQEPEETNGYAHLMNEAIEGLLRLTVWTAGYSNHSKSMEKLGSLHRTNREIGIMLGFVEEGQSDNYENGLKGVGAALDLLSKEFREDPIASVHYTPGIRATAMALMGDTVDQVVPTVDIEKDQVDKSPLETIAVGFRAIATAPSYAKAFYEDKKSILG